MEKIWLGVVLFAAPHLLSMLLPNVRDSLRTRLGEGLYKGLYSLFSLAGVGLLVLGYSAAMSGPDSALVYQPWAGAKHITMLLVFLSFIFISASHGKGHIKAVVRHPMSLGISLWALGHLLANGEKPVVVIFSMFLLLGILDLILCTVRGKRPGHTPNLRSDVIAVIVGMVIYVLFLFVFHPFILGVAVAG